jgi:hypothetical protein
MVFIAISIIVVKVQNEPIWLCLLHHFDWNWNDDSMPLATVEELFNKAKAKQKSFP